MQDPDQTLQAPYGYDVQGQPQGQFPQGQPQGQFPQGQPQGQFPQGQPQGQFPQGQPQGQFPQGQFPQGPISQGRPQGQFAQGQPPQAPNQPFHNPGPGQFSAYPSQQPAPQFSQQPPNPRNPRNPPTAKKRNLLLIGIGVVVLLLLSLGGLLVFTHGSSQNTLTHSATAQSNSGKNATASSNLPAQVGAPEVVVKSFYDAVQKQDYATAYTFTSFKAFNSDTFKTTSAQSDQSLGKLTSFTIGKATITPGTDTIKAQFAISITRANIPVHMGVAMLVLQNGTWKITDGTIWQ